MNTDKLMETINQAVQRAGGEAARVWPQMVEAWRLQAWVWAGICLVLTVAGVVCGWRCLRYAREAPGDDEIAGWVGVLCCVVLAGIAVLFFCDQIPRLIYPEATLVYSLIGSK